MADQPRLLDKVETTLPSRQEVAKSEAHAAAAITLSHASRSFATGADVVRAVDEVDLSVGWGEFVCILGTSGSGKTTLLNLVAGLDRPDSGSVRVNGHELTGLPEKALTKLRLTEMGVVFQGDNLIDEFTALENVRLPLEVAGVDHPEAIRQAEREMERVGLAGLGDRFPRQLSGGQKQRVGIARALVGGRRILLADEPTGALDSTNSRALFEMLGSICADGACVMLVTHDPLAQSFADTSYTMTDGRLARTK